jgi:hypothetical protein
MTCLVLCTCRLLVHPCLVGMDDQAQFPGHLITHRVKRLNCQEEWGGVGYSVGYVGDVTACMWTCLAIWLQASRSLPGELAPVMSSDPASHIHILCQ